jgi:hypothetical protein
MQQYYNSLNFNWPSSRGETIKRNNKALVKILELIVVPIVVALSIGFLTPVGPWVQKLIFPPTPPETDIVSVTDGDNLRVKNGGSTPSNTIMVRFAGKDNARVQGYECSIDGGPFSSCNTPYRYPESDTSVGIHSFSVRAVDNEGTDDPTPAEFELTIITSATVQGVVKNLDKPVANVEVIADDKYKDETIGGGTFFLQNVPKGIHVYEIRNNTFPLFRDKFILFPQESVKNLGEINIAYSRSQPIGQVIIRPTQSSSLKVGTVSNETGALANQTNVTTSNPLQRLILGISKVFNSSSSPVPTTTPVPPVPQSVSNETGALANQTGALANQTNVTTSNPILTALSNLFNSSSSPVPTTTPVPPVPQSVSNETGALANQTNVTTSNPILTALSKLFNSSSSPVPTTTPVPPVTQSVSNEIKTTTSNPILDALSKLFNSSSEQNITDANIENNLSHLIRSTKTELRGINEAYVPQTSLKTGPSVRLSYNESLKQGTPFHNVRVWVEASPQTLAQIERVTYFLHPTFSPDVVTQYSRQDRFGLSLSAWGQFELKAKVYFSNAEIKDVSTNIIFQPTVQDEFNPNFPIK